MKIPRAVMMSIQPQWCDLIIEGKKTVELRKTIPDSPRLRPSFKVYIYCTKSPEKLIGQKVIGYFTCHSYDIIYPDGFWGRSDKVWCSNHAENAITSYCLTEKQIKEYLKGKKGYGWHINDLVIYGEPKGIEEFGLKRPPQSWCYVYKTIDF